MELHMNERNSTTSLMPPRSHTPLFVPSDKHKPFNLKQQPSLQPQAAFGVGSLTSYGLQRPFHARGVSSSVIVSSSDNYNIANPQTPLFRNNRLQDNEVEDLVQLPATAITTTRMMHKSFTPNKNVPGMLNAKLLTQAVISKMHPGLLVQAAAVRIKVNSDQKNDKISRLELQKETLKHMQEANAQAIIVVDGPRTRAQEENDSRAKFMAKSNIKNNIISQNIDGNCEMTLQPNKFNVLGWEYKKMSDIKLRSTLVSDHLNGKYCPRDIPKRDQERYKPSKIFKTMYQKAHNEQSRNVNGEDKSNTENKNTFGAGTPDMFSTQKKVIKQNVADLIYRTQNGDPDRELISPYPKNDYAPNFVSSLNFNFNMNDVFGSTKKQASFKNVQGGSGQPSQNTKRAQDMLGSIKHSMEQRRNSLSHTLGNAKSANRSIKASNSQFETLPGFLQPGSTSSLNGNTSPLRHSTQAIHEETEQNGSLMRRKLNNQVLKSQYSYWAGMLVKKMPNQPAHERPYGPAQEQISKKGKETIDTYHIPAYSNTIVGGGIDSRNNFDYSSGASMPIVDFGDPRSMTQGISFKRKRGVYLPEQEMKMGGTTQPLAPPFLRGLMPPRMPAKKKK